MIVIDQIVAWWYRRQRRIDMEVLWPACVAAAVDLEHAKAAFAVHAFHDPAWLALGRLNLRGLIDTLEAPEEDSRYRREGLSGHDERKDFQK
jgi:hypothetical protein